ncbi:MAG: antirestriction protein [Gammaproteobacteria bacterium]|nr:antirestriction protein [Gammaproteobacteria bacterium]
MNGQETKNTIIERVRVVPESQRMTFLNKHFGTPLFDQLVFQMADKIIKGYQGGYWEYCEISYSEAAFLRLGSETNRTLCNPFSGEEIEAGDTVSGLIVTSYALAWILERYDGNALERLYDTHRAINSAILDYCEEESCLNVYYTLID